MEYKATKPTAYTGRPAKAGEYLYQYIKTGQLENILAASPGSKFNHFGVLGYGVDQGVFLNHGRMGAAAGPDAFRAQFGSLAMPFKKAVSITDYGTFYCPDQQLVPAQKRLGAAVSKLLAKRVKPLLIGGGHDMAYGHFLGIQEYLNEYHPHASLGIINIDAHLDLRMPEPEGTSGSPFLQIANHLKGANKKFNYCCVGVRRQSNPPSLLACAEKLNSTLIYREQCAAPMTLEVQEKIKKFIDKVDFIYLSIDLDAFTMGIAPGVSAASPLGIGLDFGMSVVKEILNSGKLLSMDLAELNPLYDLENSTAKLAAGLAYEYITGV